jgi:hypothetical protein
MEREDHSVAGLTLFRVDQFEQDAVSSVEDSKALSIKGVK